MKIKYILQWFYTPRDRSGNVYSYFRLTDTATGRQLAGMEVPESNARAILYHLNGNEHIQNYYYAETAITKREMNRVRIHGGFGYIGCDPEKIAVQFKEMLDLGQREDLGLA